MSVFTLTTGRKSLTMRLSDYIEEIRKSVGDESLEIGEQYYISARRPDTDGDKRIDEAQMSVSFAAGNKSGTVAILPSQLFYARCIAQITDFCLPAAEDDGAVAEARYKADNKGDNHPNRTVYEALYHSPLRDVVSAWLTEVAGVKQDVEELGNALGR